MDAPYGRPPCEFAALQSIRCLLKAIVTVSGGDTYEPHCRSNPVCIQIYVLWQSVVRQQVVQCCVSAPRFPCCYAEHRNDYGWRLSPQPAFVVGNQKVNRLDILFDVREAAYRVTEDVVGEIVVHR